MKIKACKKNQIRFLFFIYLVLIFSGASVNVASALETDKKIFILSDSDFVQQLIDATPTGEKCVIPNGEYKLVNILIKRPIHLFASENVKFKSVKDSNVMFHVSSDNVIIDGFKFELDSEDFEVVRYDKGAPEMRNNVLENEFVKNENSELLDDTSIMVYADLSEKNNPKTADFGSGAIFILPLVIIQIFLALKFRDISEWNKIFK